MPHSNQDSRVDQDRLELSIVIAAPDQDRLLLDSLRSLEAQAREHRCELLLCLAAELEPTAEVCSIIPEESILSGRQGDLVPHLWGVGLQQARAPLVAFTIGSCIPQRNWIATILELASTYPEVAGFGGPILPPPGGTAKDWAAYWVRYSGYLPMADGESTEIPGDNAVYRRDDLALDWQEEKNGFWEVLFHRRLRARDRKLWFSSRMRVMLGPSSVQRSFAKQRFRHGRHFGSTRTLPNALWRIPAALSAPILVPMLLQRIRRRVSSSRPEWRTRFRLSLIWTLLNLTSWSIGEASGYLWPGRSR